jgi:hypothetical protein
MRGSVAVLVFLVVACTEPAGLVTARPPSPLPPNASKPGAPETPWGKKTHSERMEFMGLYFFPKMRAVFQAHDARAYAQFRCQTCHGEDMEAVDYRMPNGLYGLPSQDPVGAAQAYDAATTAFMVSDVAKSAVELLGEGGTDACHLCHRTE